MDYVTWVERVFAAAMAQDDGAMGYTSSFAIAKAPSFGEPTFDDFTRRDDPRFEGLLDALADLEMVGVERPENTGGGRAQSPPNSPPK